MDARLGVNPAAHPPRGDERTGGLLLNNPAAAPGYILFTGYGNHDVFLLDPLGRVAHAWHTELRFQHAKLLDNGNLLTVAKGAGGGALELDPRGNIVWQYNIRGLHHDFLKMPNGNVMLLVQGNKTRQEAIAAGANPEFVGELGLQYDHLVEVRPTSPSEGEIVWQWSPWDHLIQDFDSTKPNYGKVAKHPELIDINFLLESRKERYKHPLSEWTHANAIDYNPALDQIMLSARHFSELWIIDHSATTEEARGHAGGNSGMGGDLLYRWGNPRAYRHGGDADQRLFWQHHTHWIPSGLPGAGNILIFNNGNEFRGYARAHSSIDEIIPPVNGYRYRRAPNSPYPPAEPAWTYAAETPKNFYAKFVSGNQRLPNGNTLITNGNTRTIFQITPDGKPVWKYIVPLHKIINPRQSEIADWSSDKIYRAYWYPPRHPGLQALDLTPGAYLQDLPDLYDKTYAAAALAAGDFGDPLANSHFDIYLDQDENQVKRRLIYIKQPCAANNAQPKFFLHIIPANARDLPPYRQEYGFDNLDFNYAAADAYAPDHACIAIAPLPNYPIDRIRTGQFADGGTLWRADIDLSD